MGLFGGKAYLRVETPQTVDGTTLKYSEDGLRVIKKETHLPLSARKHLEGENANLPNHLRHIITEVPAEVDNSKSNEAVEAKKTKTEPSSTATTGKKEEAKPKGKPGPKPKGKKGDHETASDSENEAKGDDSGGEE